MADDPTDKGGADPAQAFQGRLTKMNGDAMAFATQLFDENYRLREDRRVLGEELKEAKKATPPAGAVVLAPDKAKEYEEYQALGTAKDLKTRIEAHVTLETEVKDLKKKEVIREVAEIYGYKPSVLEALDKMQGGLEFEIRVDEKSKRKVADIKDGDKATPFPQYVEDNLADYLPSLKVEQGPPTQPVRTGHGADPRPAGQNGREVYDHAHQSLSQSGKYGF